MTTLEPPFTRSLCGRGLVVLAAAASLCGAADAQQDKAAERNARRAQMQVQSLQQQLQAAQADKAKVDGVVAEAQKRLAAETAGVARARAALRQADVARKALEAERAALKASLAAAEARLVEQKKSGDDSLAAKDQALAAALRTRDAAQAQLQARFDQQLALVGECTAKNERLVALSAELLDRYRKKDMAAVLAQREPLLGLGDVQMFNLVQDYRDKADAERFRPPPTP